MNDSLTGPASSAARYHMVLLLIQIQIFNRYSLSSV